MAQQVRPLRVSIVAVPEAQVTPLSGLFEILSSFGLLASLESDLPAKPFEVEIVAPRDAPSRGASGLPIAADRLISEVDRTDIAIVPLMMFAGDCERHCVRHARVSSFSPKPVCWLAEMRRSTGRLLRPFSAIFLT